MLNIILNLEINGKILNKFNEPIQDAYIKCNNERAISDSSGNFSLKTKIPCKMEIKHPLYKDTSFINNIENPLIILNFKEYPLKEQEVISNKIDAGHKIKNPEFNDIILNSSITDVEFNPSGLSVSIKGIPSKFTNIYLDGINLIGRTFEVIDISTIPLNSIKEINVKNLNLYVSTEQKNGLWLTLKTSRSYGLVLNHKNIKYELLRNTYNYINNDIFYSKYQFEKFSFLQIHSEKKVLHSERISDTRLLINFHPINLQIYRHSNSSRNFKNENYEYLFDFNNRNVAFKNWGYYGLEYGFYVDYLGGNNLLKPVGIIRSKFSIEFYRDFLFKLSFENTKPSISFEYKNFELFLISKFPSIKELYMNFIYPELKYKVVGNSNLENEYLFGASVEIFGTKINYSKIFNYIGFANAGYSDGYVIYSYENIKNLEIYSINFERTIKYKDYLISGSFFIGKTPIDIPQYKLKIGIEYKGLNASFWTKDKTELIPRLSSFDIMYSYKFKLLDMEFRVDDVLDNTASVYLPYFVGRTFTMTLKFNFENF
ncbi:MAG: hypothetical protein N2504_05435 [candidate division WOR-3 bacterium]|nr:hypothetical protein [candidate division WOR-3 bacterium]MCX7948012.1 hypothetical protein [candidate division WOR-3 bacterium]MDW8151090.1 TonB-dependent receptor [candidate division WOR-3 bacterium]